LPLTCYTSRIDANIGLRSREGDSARKMKEAGTAV
jgi:hypothetical protein